MRVEHPSSSITKSISNKRRRRVKSKHCTVIARPLASVTHSAVGKRSVKCALRKRNPSRRKQVKSGYRSRRRPAASRTHKVERTQKTGSHSLMATAASYPAKADSSGSTSLTEPPRAASRNDGGAFEEARVRTRHALRQLAARWRDEKHPPDSCGAELGVSGRALQLAEDKDDLTTDGFAWSQVVGLNYVLPSGALQTGGTDVQAISKSLDRDGLHTSRIGGSGPRTHPGILIAPAPPCGYGAFTTERLCKGQKLGEYTGEVRCYELWVEEIRQLKLKRRGADISVPFIVEELYAAWTGNGPAGRGVVVDAFCAGNAMRFINCSCSANCTFKPFGEGGEKHHRLEVVTLRQIEPWEQLSVDYGWYFDPPTLDDVRNQALQAYNDDIVAINAMLAAGGAITGGGSIEEVSEAVQAIADAIAEERSGRTVLRKGSPESFLRRFVDPRVATRLMVSCEGSRPLPKAKHINEVPDAVFQLYEVVGAERVGIPCRCALEPSFGARNRCSGIIGRPMQDVLSGRDEELAAKMAPEWL